MSNREVVPTIELSITGGLATLIVSNPTRRNALTPALADELVDAFDKVNEDLSVGALVVKGANGTFCSGADLASLSQLQKDPVSDESYDALERIYRAFSRLAEVRVPTIAAVRGSAVGAGMNLAMAADVRIVSHDARLISGFLKIGVHPGGGHFQMLAQAANREVATAMGILSQEVSGERACSLGLAWESLDDADVEGRAEELASVPANDPALSRYAIHSLRSTNPPVVPASVALQAERSPQLWSFRRASPEG
jgi:enoyl-CoA hydratase/carnithine racemase